jgi:CubicO group peptidase (beta-lactamase class C family)
MSQKKQCIRVFILLSQLLALTSTIIAAELSDTQLSALTKELQTRVDAGKLSGAVLSVAQNGETKMVTALGYQNVEDQLVMQEDTIFRIYSMTKPVTGTALMILYDEGKFSLDDPLEKHLPELQGLTVAVSFNEDQTWETVPTNSPVTIRQLMSHTGGFAYFPPLYSGPIAEAYVNAGISGASDKTLAQSMPLLKGIPLLNQPGEEWVYSISVDIQGYLVEQLSGQKLDVFMKERIFNPLGMEDTGFYVPEEKQDRLSRKYFPRAGELIRTDNSSNTLGGSFREKPQFLSGGGGLTSTVSDYMKFAQMHLNMGVFNDTRILSKEAAGLMRRNQLPDSISQIGRPYPGNQFGLDFAIVGDSDLFQGASEGTFWWWGIAGSWFWIDPQENIIVIGMIQNDDIGLSIQIQRAARAAIYQ